MDPRYPVGPFTADAQVTPGKRRAWIAQLDSLPQDLRGAIAGLPAGGLDTPYRDGGWTARQVVHHLADSHLNAYTRVKLALTESVPAIKTYEEHLWAELADGRAQDLTPSLAILDGIHRRLTLLLDSLPADQFSRTATHPSFGVVSVDWLLQMYAWHCRHHLAHIELARQRAA